MSTLMMRKLNNDLQNCYFDCGNPSINAMVKGSYYPTLLQHLYSYEVAVDNITVGYYMIGFRHIKLSNCPGEIAEYKSNMSELCYSLHLYYIAINKRYQNRGFGTKALQLLIKAISGMCETWPIRMVTLCALKEKVSWYESIGFSLFHRDDMTNDKPDIEMYLDPLLDRHALSEYCS